MAARMRPAYLNVAALAPILCAIHCSLLPLSVSVLSALSLSDRVQNAASADGHHHHGEAGWFEAYVLPASLGLGWAAQGWLYYRDRSVRRLTLATVGLGLITAKTVAPYMGAATMHEQNDVHDAMPMHSPTADLRRLILDHAMSISLVGSALLIGSSFIRGSAAAASVASTTGGAAAKACCKKEHV